MELLLKVLSIVLRAFNYLVQPLIVLVGGQRRTEPFPPIRDDLLKLSATELADRIRQRKLRSEDIVRAYIDRVRVVNPLINAVVEDCFDVAVAQAKEVDKELASSQLAPSELLKQRPLLGVPLTVKESCSLKGSAITGGVAYRSHLKAEADGTTVGRLRAAGAIPILVSNTPEYCMGFEAYNTLTGRTLNPYDRRRTAGGSSGGEAALLGSGASVIGVGSDLGGSIRIPAMFCGVFGHKPTAAVVAIEGHVPMVGDVRFNQFLTLGPMCRYSVDLPLMLGVMAGPEAAQLRLDEPIAIEKVKVFYPPKLDLFVNAVPVSNDVKVALRSAVKYFQNRGNVTQSVAIKHYEHSMQLSASSLQVLEQIPLAFEDPNANVLAEFVKMLLRQSRHTFSVVFMYLLDKSKLMASEKQHSVHRQMAAQMKQDIVDKLGTDGVLLLPSFPKAAIRHYESFGHVTGFMHTMILNALGLPATQVPLGFNKDGMPIGIQVVGAPYQDRLCMRVAQELEKGFGGWKPPQ